MADLIERDYLIRKFEYTDPPAVSEMGKGFDLGVAAALRVVKSAPAVNLWIPCSERLPEQSGLYLAYFTFKNGTHATDIAYINTGCHLGSITHWMQLPEPPKGDEVNDGSN